MIEILSFYLLNLIIIILNHYDTITNTVTIALFFAVGILIFILRFAKLRWLRRRVGGVAVVIDKYWVNEFLLIVIMAAFYSAILKVIVRPNANPEYYFPIYISIFPFYFALLDIFSKNVIGKKGIVYNGKILTWDRIESYHWIENKSRFRKGFSKLLIKIQPTFWIGEITLKVKNTQKDEIDLFLNRIINLKEPENDR